MSPPETVAELPEVDFIFADDSRQRKPSRPGMGNLVAIGGINVAAEVVGPLSRRIDEICQDTGFPPGEPLKWSPGRELWMHTNLVGEDRFSFFVNVLNTLREFEAVAMVVVEDANAAPATGAASPEADVTNMFLERVDLQCSRGGSHGFVVVDRPGGDRRDEDAFLGVCLETLQAGTRYVKPSHIAHNVLSTPARLSRPLQAADLVVSSTLAVVSGEQTFAPPVFELVKRILDASMGRIAGFGLKLHPDFRFANLYHWLLGESHFWKGNAGVPMPLGGRPYADDPFVL
jgi:hypothetical protein